MTQIPSTEEWLLHPQVASGTLVVFFCPVCSVLPLRTAEKQDGEPQLLPLAGCLKTLAAAQEASGWPGQACCAPADFEPDSYKSTHCYSPGTCCLVDFQAQTASKQVRSLHFSRIQPSLAHFLILCITSHFHTKSKHPCRIPSLCTQCDSVLCSLFGKVSIVKGSFNKRGIAWKGQERASGGEPPSDED